MPAAVPKGRYGHVVNAHGSAGAFRVINCFSELYYPNGTPTPWLAQAQANLGVPTTQLTLAPPITTPNTTADALILPNYTPATAGNQSFSPAIHWIGQGFAVTPAASQTVEYRAYVAPIQWNPVSFPSLNFDYQINGGGWKSFLTLRAADPSQTGGLNPQILAINGYFNSPAYSFAASTGSGMWFNASNGVGISCANSVCVTCTGNALTIFGNGGIQHTGRTFANLAVPAPVAGMQSYLTDGPSGLAIGAIVSAGGGTTKYMVWFNGTNWTVIGT